MSQRRIRLFIATAIAIWIQGLVLLATIRIVNIPVPTMLAALLLAGMGAAAMIAILWLDLDEPQRSLSTIAIRTSRNPQGAHPLATRLGLPLEREYEAWIVEEIELYFAGLGCSVDTWAVSPRDEKTWPADHALKKGTKLLGLQFKRPHVSAPAFSKLSWRLDQPPGQVKGVYHTPEIVYCLPTFAHRDWRHQCLHHCIFWRPTSASHGSIWYANAAAPKSPDSKLIDHPNATRWGVIAEGLMRCTSGKLLDGSARQYVKSIHEAFGNADEGHGDDHDDELDPFTFYLFAIRVPLDDIHTQPNM